MNFLMEAIALVMPASNCSRIPGKRFAIYGKSEYLVHQL
jgi:hypothetical protein